MIVRPWTLFSYYVDRYDVKLCSVMEWIDYEYDLIIVMHGLSRGRYEYMATIIFVVNHIHELIKLHRLLAKLSLSIFASDAFNYIHIHGDRQQLL